MIECESNLVFDFDDAYTVSKFDDTDFYRNKFNAMPRSKAVDFLAVDRKKYVFIEVKNCVGNESINRWRIDKNNRKRDTASTTADRSDRDSLDIEMAEKVTMTIAALFGAFTRPTPHACSDACESVAASLFSDAVRNGEREIFVILLLDGEFGCHSRKDNMIRETLQKSIKKKLKWLKCTVLVTDSKQFSTEQSGISVRPQTI